MIDLVKHFSSRSRRGQVLTEFVVFVMMVFTFCGMLVFFMAIFSEWSWRVLRLIGLETP